MTTWPYWNIRTYLSFCNLLMYPDVLMKGQSNRIVCCFLVSVMLSSAIFLVLQLSILLKQQFLKTTKKMVDECKCFAKRLHVGIKPQLNGDSHFQWFVDILVESHPSHLAVLRQADNCMFLCPGMVAKSQWVGCTSGPADQASSKLP